MFFSGETSTQPAAWFRPQGSGRELLHSGAEETAVDLALAQASNREKGALMTGGLSQRPGQNKTLLPCPLGSQRHQSSGGRAPWDVAAPCHSPALCNAQGNKHSPYEHTSGSKAMRSTTGAAQQHQRDSPPRLTSPDKKHHRTSPCLTPLMPAAALTLLG